MLAGLPSASASALPARPQQRLGLGCAWRRRLGACLPRAPGLVTPSLSVSFPLRLMAPGSSSGGSSRDSSCRGFVGEGGSSVAGEYHCADFTWESRVEEGEAAVARQLHERAAWLQQQQQQRVQQQQQQQGQGQGPDPTAGPQPSTQRPGDPASSALTLPARGSPHAPPNNSDSPPTCDALPYDRSSWEGFHSTHSQARFFKERRYLLLEFPQLGVLHPPQHFVEVGCGCGSSLLPVLRANPTCRVTGCDISPTAVRLFLEAAERYSIDPQRVSAFAFDAAGSKASARPSATSDGSGPVSPSAANGSRSGGGGNGSLDGTASAAAPATAAAAAAAAASPLAGLGADAALLIFTLSALLPEEMPAMLRHAWRALRPGGALLFRDYGRYDMAMLRFPGPQMLGPDLYRRSDGTLAYFFTPEGLAVLAAEAGFEVEECEYHCVALRNRKQGGQDMKRVFVHGIFRKPEV